MSNLFIKSISTLIAILSVTAIMAQPPTPPATPIDGGLGVLLAGGAAYGLKKLQERRKDE